MSNQEKEVLAGLCRIEIKRWRKARDKQYMVDLMQVALGELTEGWKDRAEKAEAQLETARRAVDNLSAERDALRADAHNMVRSIIASDSIEHVDFIFEGKIQQLREGK